MAFTVSHHLASKQDPPNWSASAQRSPQENKPAEKMKGIKKQTQSLEPDAKPEWARGTRYLATQSAQA